MTQNDPTPTMPSAALALREPARRARLGLLVVSACILLLATGTVDPGMMTGLGGNAEDRGLLEYLFLGLLSFLALSFLCYTVADLSSWRSRGGAGGVIGFLFTPILLVLEVGLPMVLAAAATFCMVPELEEGFGSTRIRRELACLRAEQITDRVRGRGGRTLAWALAQPDPAAAEEALELALLELRLARPDMLGPNALDVLESELEALHDVMSVASLVDEAWGATARGELVQARALAAEARWRWPEAIAPGVASVPRVEETATELERLEELLRRQGPEPGVIPPVRDLPPIR